MKEQKQNAVEKVLQSYAIENANLKIIAQELSDKVNELKTKLKESEDKEHGE